jgi:hypothetical protein
MKFTYAAALIASVNAGNYLRTRQLYAYNPGFASKYSIPAAEEHTYSLPEPVEEPTVVEKRCAQVDLNWNYFGIDGVLDIELKSNGMVLFDGDFADLTEGDHETYVMSLPVDGDSCDNSGTTFHYIGDAHADKHGDASIYRWRDVSFDDLIGKSVQIRGRYQDYGIPRLASQPAVTLPLDPSGTAVTPATRPYADGLFRTRDVQACGNIVEIECPGAVQPSTPSYH